MPPNLRVLLVKPKHEASHVTNRTPPNDLASLRTALCSTNWTGIWQRQAWSPLWTFHRLYRLHARCVYTPLLWDFRCCFFVFQTITCRPAKASSILFGSNLQMQTCREINTLASLIFSQCVLTLFFYSFAPACPPQTIRKVKFFTSRKSQNSDVGVQDQLDESEQNKSQISIT